MTRTNTLCLLVAATLAAPPAFAQHARPVGTGMAPAAMPYVSQSSNAVGLAREIPCGRIVQNTDGSWTIPGSIVMNGTTMTNQTFPRGQDDATLDARCGQNQDMQR